MKKKDWIYIAIIITLLILGIGICLGIWIGVPIGKTIEETGYTEDGKKDMEHKGREKWLTEECSQEEYHNPKKLIAYL